MHVDVMGSMRGVVGKNVVAPFHVKRVWRHPVADW